MSESDSDYDVEEFIKPDTIRRTYNNEDQLSEPEEESQDESDKSEGEKSEEDEAEIKTQSCKLNNGTNGTNGFTESDVSEPVKVPPPQSSEPAKTNSRFILYVTNLTAEITRTILEDFFSDAGAVKSIRIPKIRMGCYAFVEMKDFEGYKVSQHHLHIERDFNIDSFQNGLKFNNREIDGRKIQVYEGSKNKKHTTNTSKDMKRKKQQAHLSTISMSKKMKPNK